jgi:hypothetical protein
MATRSLTSKNDRHSGEAAWSDFGGREREEHEGRGYLERGNDQFRELMADREGQAALAALAFGFGVGLVIGYSIGGSTRHRDHWSDRIAAEGLGRRFLDRLESMLPESITSRMGK